MTQHKKLKPLAGPSADLIAGAISAGQRREAYQPKQRDAGGKTVRITVHAPPATHEVLRRIAADRHTSLQQIIAAAVDLWFRNESLPNTFYPIEHEQGKGATSSSPSRAHLLAKQI